MKKTRTFLAIILFISLLFTAFSPEESKSPAIDTYIVLAWNDLGMHCSNMNFENLCILPPYNNHTAQVIKVGSSTSLPLVMGLSSGFSVTYEIPGNTYSVGKTNFWSYDLQLFGVNLPDNVGLTGNGLTGTMIDSNTYFFATGIPITPYTDNNLVTENPYQLTLIKAFNSSNQLIASTQSVIPVSNEMHCVSSGCHSSEMDILERHEEMQGFNINNRPIICANCHADPALGMPGNGEAPSFSEAVHSKHGEFITTDCYKCHPGPNTQCFRDTMFTAGLTCVTCHGNVAHVAQTIQQSRTPWLQEPSCGAVACHGPNYAENPGKLFRQSRGHGNLYCSACHNSPHAILPTNRPEDNVQNIALQGYRGTLGKCSVCHGYTPTAPGPHGLYGIPDSKTLTLTLFLEGLYNGGGTMNQAQDETGPRFGSGIADQITVELHNASSYNTIVYVSSPINLGVDGHATLTIPDLYNGVYYITIKHRNSIETTSATATPFSSASINYNFDLVSMVYGSNLKLVSGKYCIYTGNVNQDDIVDSGDMNPVENASVAITVGYVVEDVNGDGIIDSGDMIIIENNSMDLITVITP